SLAGALRPRVLRSVVFLSPPDHDGDLEAERTAEPLRSQTRGLASHMAWLRRSTAPGRYPGFALLPPPGKDGRSFSHPQARRPPSGFRYRLQLVPLSFSGRRVHPRSPVLFARWVIPGPFPPGDPVRGETAVLGGWFVPGRLRGGQPGVTLGLSFSPARLDRRV